MIDLYNSLKGISKTSFAAFINDADNSFTELNHSFHRLNQLFVDSGISNKIDESVN